VHTVKPWLITVCPLFCHPTRLTSRLSSRQCVSKTTRQPRCRFSSRAVWRWTARLGYRRYIAVLRYTPYTTLTMRVPEGTVLCYTIHHTLHSLCVCPKVQCCATLYTIHYTHYACTRRYSAVLRYTPHTTLTMRAPEGTVLCYAIHHTLDSLCMCPKLQLWISREGELFKRNGTVPAAHWTGPHVDGAVGDEGRSGGD
jgi:hypothetical protein